MRITRTEAFRLIDKWAETDAPVNMVFWGYGDGEAPFLQMAIDEIASGPNCVNIIGPHDAIFTVSVPEAEDDGSFYFCAPAEYLGSETIKDSRIAAQLAASNTPALCIATKTGVLMIYDHPGDDFLAEFNEQMEARNG
ncbi:MAG: hypothetical protein ACRD3O_10195 [Terriglobia bacterium]